MEESQTGVKYREIKAVGFARRVLILAKRAEAGPSVDFEKSSADFKRGYPKFGGSLGSEAKDSALLVRVTELLEAIAHGLANTEAAEQPVVRVSTAVVYGSTVAFVVTTGLSSWRRSTLDLVVRFRGLGRRDCGRHVCRAGGSIALGEV